MVPSRFVASCRTSRVPRVRTCVHHRYAACAVPDCGLDCVGQSQPALLPARWLALCAQARRRCRRRPPTRRTLPSMPSCRHVSSGRARPSALPPTCLAHSRLRLSMATLNSADGCADVGCSAVRLAAAPRLPDHKGTRGRRPLFLCASLGSLGVVCQNVKLDRSVHLDLAIIYFLQQARALLCSRLCSCIGLALDGHRSASLLLLDLPAVPEALLPRQREPTGVHGEQGGRQRLCRNVQTHGPPIWRALLLIFFLY